jgi:hypothetical protein
MGIAMLRTSLVFAGALLLATIVSAQSAPPAPAGGRQGGGRAAGAAPPRVTRPPLFFKEEWRQTPANDEHPVTQQSVASPTLELKLYGPSSEHIQLTGRAGDESNPIHVWTGECTSPCALAFRDRTNFADLSGLARIRWNTKTSGFHQIRPIVKLADGTWLVGDRADGTPRDWLISEFSLADVRWLRLDIDRVVTTGNIVERVDLSKVDEIGFADLMPGSGHGPGGWVDVAQFEVYGRPVAR